jgi:hypothetical protein
MLVKLHGAGLSFAGFGVARRGYERITREYGDQCGTRFRGLDRLVMG